MIDVAGKFRAVKWDTKSISENRPCPEVGRTSFDNEFLGLPAIKLDAKLAIRGSACDDAYKCCTYLKMTG